MSKAAASGRSRAAWGDWRARSRLSQKRAGVEIRAAAPCGRDPGRGRPRRGGAARHRRADRGRRRCLQRRRRGARGRPAWPGLALGRSRDRPRLPLALGRHGRRGRAGVGLRSRPAQRVLLGQLSGRVRGARAPPDAREPHRLPLRAGPRRWRDACRARRSRTPVRHPQCPPDGRPSHPVAFGDRIMRGADLHSSPALRPHGGAASWFDGGDDAERFRTRLSGDRRSALRAGLAWVDGFVPAARVAGPACRASISRAGACIRARACRWRRCRGSSRPRASRRTSLRRAGPPRRLCVVVRRRAERGRARGADADRLHRLGVLALLRLDRPARSRRPLCAQRRPLRHPSPLGHDRAGAAARCARATMRWRSARAGSPGTDMRSRSTSTKSRRRSPRGSTGRFGSIRRPS